jgi:hypothetical protein
VGSTPTPGTNLYGLVFIPLTGPFAKCAEFAIRVEGNYPAEFKWCSELSDGDIRDVQKRGGRVIVMSPDYGLSDLEDARKQCSL